jgi:hypothetical protein
MQAITDKGRGKARRPLYLDIAFVLLGTAAILAVPLLGMLASTEVNWSLADFALMGVLLATTGFMYLVVARNVGNRRYQLLVGLALLIALALVWVELAVGVFGTPFAGS